jgi:hypothetical protein
MPSNGLNVWVLDQTCISMGNVALITCKLGTFVPLISKGGWVGFQTSLQWGSGIHYKFNRHYKSSWFFWLEKLIKNNPKVTNVVTLALGFRPRQGFARVRAKKEAQECGRVWRNDPSHSQVNSHFGNWSHDGLSNFQRAIVGVKTHWIETFLLSLKSSWNINV